MAILRRLVLSLLCLTILEIEVGILGEPFHKMLIRLIIDLHEFHDIGWLTYLCVIVFYKACVHKMLFYKQ